MTKVTLKLISVGLVLGLMANCSGEENEIDLSSIPIPITNPTASASEPLVFTLTTTWFGSADETAITFNETGTAECVASTTTPVVTCTADIPEAQLYYSNLRFRYAYNTSLCTLVRFHPMYYPASNNVAYIPPGETAAIDCSGIGGGAEDADCWGGAAPVMVTGFPTNDHLVTFPVEGSSGDNDLTLNSAYSYTYGSNRRTTNDISVAASTTDIVPAALSGAYTTTDGYLGATVQPIVDWMLECDDEFQDTQPYIINLVITESDGLANERMSFKEQ